MHGGDGGGVSIQARDMSPRMMPMPMPMAAHARTVLNAKLLLLSSPPTRQRLE